VVEKIETFKHYTARMTAETITVCFIKYLIQCVG